MGKRTSDDYINTFLSKPGKNNPKFFLASKVSKDKIINNKKVMLALASQNQSNLKSFHPILASYVKEYELAKKTNNQIEDVQGVIDDVLEEKNESSNKISGNTKLIIGSVVLGVADLLYLYNNYTKEQLIGGVVAILGTVFIIKVGIDVFLKLLDKFLYNNFEDEDVLEEKEYNKTPEIKKIELIIEEGVPEERVTDKQKNKKVIKEVSFFTTLFTNKEFDLKGGGKGK